MSYHFGIAIRFTCNVGRRRHTARRFRTRFGEALRQLVLKTFAGRYEATLGNIGQEIAWTVRRFHASDML
jgi:hypothetical protein